MTQLPPINFAALADALLQRAGQLLPQWLPDGVLHGHEYQCASLTGGAGKSTSVNTSNGRWSDFATGEKGGDLLALYAAVYNLPMAQAALQVARAEGLEDVAGIRGVAVATGAQVPQPRPTPQAAVPRPKTDEGWATVVPVPALAPQPTYRHQYRETADIEHLATYRYGEDVYGYVVRFKTSDGGKETLPYTWCASARDGAAKWHWRTWDCPRPLYVPNGQRPAAAAGLTVVLVEGERKADILQSTLDAGAPGVYQVASWPGGCKAWAKADWSPLAGCTLLLWPDCDAKREPLTRAERSECSDETEVSLVQALKPLLPPHKQPGMAAMLSIGAMLRKDHGCAVQLLPIPSPLVVPDGWDCADAITTDGWDCAAVLALFGRAQPLPGADVPTDADGPQKAKTRDGLGGTKGSDSADADVGGGGRDGLTPPWLAPFWDSEKGRWLVSRKLVIKALENDPDLQGVLAYNELSNTLQARRAWPWQHGKAGDITDAVDLLLGQYLSTTYGLPSIPRAALTEAIQTVAHSQRFHPVRDYLGGLQWDGKPRVDKWLIHALGESLETLTPSMAEYLSLVGRCWILGMVYRVMQPGCKFDYCPVLEGVGGLRKSTMVEVLGSTPFYSDTPFEVGRGKEAQEQVAGLWIYEIAEMTHFSKAEVGAIKAFISSKVDRYRVAYGQTVQAFDRQCVLVGTTNESTYLYDRTGNRRFWPIPVRKVINIEWLAKYRDLLFAEAYALYLEGAAYTPTPDQERRLFQPMQEARLVETAVVSDLLSVLTRDPQAAGIGAVVNGLTDFVTISQLCLALGVDSAKATRALEKQVTTWMDHEGWQRVKRQINGVRAWGYSRPRDWPNDGQENDMALLTDSGADLTTTEEDADDVPI